MISSEAELHTFLHYENHFQQVESLALTCGSSFLVVCVASKPIEEMFDSIRNSTIYQSNIIVLSRKVMHKPTDKCNWAFNTSEISFTSKLSLGLTSKDMALWSHTFSARC